MQSSEEKFNTLLVPDSEEGSNAWSAFLFNVDAARALRGLPPDKAGLLLAAGHGWSGRGWTTSRASRQLHQLTGVPLVAATISAYRDAWLFALSVVLDVEVAGLDLTDRSSEAAFALASVIQGDQEREKTPQEELAAGAATGQAEEETAFEWEEEPEELASDLQVLWKKYSGAGGTKFDIRAFLDQVPTFSQLPQKAPENNHRQDGKSGIDRALKAAQQSQLHSLRVQAHIYGGLLEGADAESLKAWAQQSFAMGVEVYKRLERERREISLPGSTPADHSQLFGKEEVALAGMAGRVNGSRPFRTPLSMFTPQASSLGPYSFRPYSGGFKGFKGFKGGRFQGNQGNQFQGGMGSSYQSSWRGRGFKGKGAKGRGTNTFSKPGWLSSPLSQAKIPNSMAMVGEMGQQGSLASPVTWCGTRFCMPNTSHHSSGKIIQGSRISIANHFRLHAARCLQRSQHGRYLLPCALVCTEEERNRGGRK